MKTIIISAVGLVVCLAAVGKTAEIKSLQVTDVPPVVQETFQTRQALSIRRYTYPVHREEWRREGLELRAFDRPRRNLDIGRGERVRFFQN
jgi:hypothetical protein